MLRFGPETFTDRPDSIRHATVVLVFSLLHIKSVGKFLIKSVLISELVDILPSMYVKLSAISQLCDALSFFLQKETKGHFEKILLGLCGDN